jgi:magnesium chelatase subunit I
VRIEIMRLVAANEADPEAFAKRWADADEAILKRVAKGKARLAKLSPGDDLLRDAAELCLAVGADGLRGELTLMRAARALAALDGAKKVTRKHLIAIAPSALRHRLRRDVLDETGSTARITRAIAELFG